ncbi:DUF6090 family protein [uncultured Psychroserpens sp.]|uniref:DUF6090 family protein n=1 Tax=uncultured Psychroserpens sp. TaxID=255436 RepID=UPI002623C2E0|nr:DUF6090 family protein [uncultured Psychroserpens sp.]
MIKFFRRIRQRLLSENKFSKYLLYAIGEIILVVIGILIALQINNWNEERKERTIELSYLNRLVIDLEENKTLWQKTLQRKKKQLDAAHIFLNFRFSKNQDTIIKILPHFQNLGTWKDININQVTFNEMVSSGSLNLISNDSIKIKLLNLDKLYKAILNNQDVLKAEHNDRLHGPTMKIINTSNAFVIDPNQRNVIKRKLPQEEMGIYFNQFQRDLITLINDKEFINGIVGITYNAQSQFRSFEEALVRINDVIVLLKKELNND